MATTEAHLRVSFCSAGKLMEITWGVRGESKTLLSPSPVPRGGHGGKQPGEEKVGSNPWHFLLMVFGK